jgi:uncharacterized protein (DUF2141 family)
MSMAILSLLTVALLPSTPDLGKAEAACRASEPGPAFMVDVEGLKDRQGTLKLELYPANDHDFLEDDNILISQGKTFRRVEVPVPQSGTPHLCIRAPAAGSYALMVLHDRDGNHKLTLSTDGVGFPNNPRLGWSKPKAAKVAAQVSSGITELHIIMNYNKGFYTFRPLKERD